MATAVNGFKENLLDFENVNVNAHDDPLSIPPKGFEKVVKSLETMREVLKDKDAAISYEVPEDIKNYIQNMHNPEVLPEGFEKLPHEIQHKWMMKYYIQYIPVFPKNLGMLAAGMLHSGDNGRDPLEVPEWLDLEKFRRGQAFIQDRFFELSFSMLITFLGVYSFQDGLRSIVVTKQSSTPFNSFYRYTQVLQAYWTWCTSDPWKEGSAAFKCTQYVRKLHQHYGTQFKKKTFQELIDASTIKKPWCPMREQLIRDFQSVCPRTNVLQRPYVLLQDYPKKAKNFHQADMFVTTAGFITLPLLYPEKVGLHGVSDEDLEAFCHFWKAMGFLLGVYDEYNICNGSLEEIRQQLRNIIEHWMKPNFTEISAEWEHVLRCMLEGISYYLFTVPFELVVLILTEIIEIPMPRLRASLSLYSRFIYTLIWLHTTYLTKVTVIRKLINMTAITIFKSTWNVSREKSAKLKKKSDEVMAKNFVVI